MILLAETGDILLSSAALIAVDRNGILCRKCAECDLTVRICNGDRGQMCAALIKRIAERRNTRRNFQLCQIRTAVKGIGELLDAVLDRDLFQCLAACKCPRAGLCDLSRNIRRGQADAAVERISADRRECRGQLNALEA